MASQLYFATHSLKLPVFPGCHLANLPKSQTVRMAICVLTICAHSLSRPEIYDFCSLLVVCNIVSLLQNLSHRFHVNPCELNQ